MEVSCRQTTLGSRHRGNEIRLPAPDRSITPPRSADPARTRRPEKSVLDRSRTAPVPLVPAPADDCTDELRDAPDRRAASAWIEDGPTAPPGASPPPRRPRPPARRPRLLHSPPPHHGCTLAVPAAGPARRLHDSGTEQALPATRTATLRAWRITSKSTRPGARFDRAVQSARSAAICALAPTSAYYGL